MAYKVEYYNWFRAKDGLWDFDIVTLIFNSQGDVERELEWRKLRTDHNAVYWVTDMNSNRIIETNEPKKNIWPL